MCSVLVVGQSNDSSCRAGHTIVIFLAGKAVIVGHDTFLGFKSGTEMAAGRKKEKDTCWKQTLRCFS